LFFLFFSEKNKKTKEQKNFVSKKQKKNKKINGHKKLIKKPRKKSVSNFFLFLEIA